jgi:hypothetical protein
MIMMISNRTSSIRPASRVLAVLVMVGGLNCLAAAPAQAKDAAERKDRSTYNKLVRQIRVARSKLADLERKAVAKAHDNGGTAPDPIKAEILSVQDDIDRKTNRLELITLRHGWEMPDFENDQGKTGTVDALASREAVFGPVDRMVQRAMHREATQLAATVYLPIISNPLRD